jgi:hypothetical protein
MLVGAALLVTMVALPKTFAGDGSPGIYGDVGQRLQVRTHAGASQFSHDLAYMVGLKGSFDWLSYQVAMNNNGGLTNSNWAAVTTFNGGAAGAVPFTRPGLAVALARANFTVNVLDTLWLDFGIFDNPLTHGWYEFRWDRDKAVYGAAQRLEVGDFFADAVWHWHSTNLATTSGMAAGSILSNLSHIMIAADMGYTFDFTDTFSMMLQGEYIYQYDRHEVGGNLMFDIGMSEGYPLLIWVSGYLPINKAALDRNWNVAGAFRIQYGDLSMDDSWMVAFNAAIWGQSSFIANQLGWKVNAAAPNSTAATVGANWSSWRLTQANAIIAGATGGNLKGSTAALNFGGDFWYRFASWFQLGAEVDFATLMSAVRTNNTSTSLYAALIGRAVF